METIGSDIKKNEYKPGFQKSMGRQKTRGLWETARRTSGRMENINGVGCSRANNQS